MRDNDRAVVLLEALHDQNKAIFGYMGYQQPGRLPRSDPLCRNALGGSSVGVATRRGAW